MYEGTVLKKINFHFDQQTDLPIKCRTSWQNLKNLLFSYKYFIELLWIIYFVRIYNYTFRDKGPWLLSMLSLIPDDPLE